MKIDIITINKKNIYYNFSFIFTKKINLIKDRFAFSLLFVIQKFSKKIMGFYNMKVFRKISQINLTEFENKKRFLTIGAFDGIHLGHRVLIDRIKDLSQKENGISVVFTFSNHPLEALASYYAPEYLSLPDEKIKIFEELGIDILVMPVFNKSIANLSPQKFIEQILVEKLNVSGVVCGFDFKFGKGGKGNVEILKEFGSKHGFFVEVIEPFKIYDQIISSTHIRELIKEGDVDIAAKYLTRPYCLKGKVEKGFGIGKTLGYPTANICTSKNVVIPGSGVYIVEILIENNKYKGMLNIGQNPTFPEKCFSIEVNIFDYNNSLYGKEISVNFLKRIRDEIKFDNKEKLIEQIKIDEETANAFFKQ